MINFIDDVIIEFIEFIVIILMDIVNYDVVISVFSVMVNIEDNDIFIIVFRF